MVSLSIFKTRCTTSFSCPDAGSVTSWTVPLIFVSVCTSYFGGLASLATAGLMTNARKAEAISKDSRDARCQMAEMGDMDSSSGPADQT
jgi:hypothetical protein